MANINDALGAFALGTLSKAAGQDFLTPMLDDVRQRDFAAAQRKAAEDAMLRDRDRRRKETAASRANMLKALSATGAIADEDIVASGGVEVMSQLDDGEFTLLLQSLGDKQTRGMADADFIRVVEGMLIAAGKPVPQSMTREQAVSLKSSLDYEAVIGRQKKEQQRETLAASDAEIDALGQRIGALLSQPYTVKSGDTEAVLGKVTMLHAQLRDRAEDLGEFGPALLSRVDGMAAQAQQLRVQEHANMFAKQPAESIIATWGRLDPLLQEATAQRPAVANVLTALDRKIASLQRMSREQAKLVGLEGAWVAAEGVDTPQELMGDPSRAQAVFKADTQGAEVRLQDRLAHQQATASAEATLAQFMALSRQSGAFANIAPSLEAIPLASLVHGTDGAYTVDIERLTTAAAASLLAEIGQMGPEELQRLDATFDFQRGIPAADAIYRQVGPAIQSRRMSILRDATPPEIEALGDDGFTAAVADLGEASASLFDVEGAVHAPSLSRMSGAVRTALRAEREAKVGAVKAQEQTLSEMQAFFAGDSAYTGQIKLMEKEFAENNEAASLVEMSGNLMEDVFRNAYLGVQAGDSWGEAAAQALTDQLGGQFRTVQNGALESPAWELVAEKIQKVTAAGGDPAEAVFEAILAGADELSKVLGGGAEIKDARANAIRDEVAKWREVYGKLPEEFDDSQISELSKLMGFARPKDADPRALMFSYMVGNR